MLLHILKEMVLEKRTRKGGKGSKDSLPLSPPLTPLEEEGTTQGKDAILKLSKRGNSQVMELIWREVVEEHGFFEHSSSSPSSESSQNDVSFSENQNQNENLSLKAFNLEKLLSQGIALDYLSSIL